jgi:oligosaccharyltransferase complex subunit delta (ribophorin II)
VPFLQSQKDLPVQFLSALDPLDAEIVIGSFGSSKGYQKTAFQLKVSHDPNTLIHPVEVKRYGKLPEIHHIFKSGPSSPPIIVPALFVLAVVFPLPVLLSSVSLEFPYLLKVMLRYAYRD